MKIGKPGTE